MRETHENIKENNKTNRKINKAHLKRRGRKP
jgi:hypothetical protein